MTQPIEITRWVIAGLVTAVLVWAAISDVRERRIPNWTVLAVAALFLPWAVTSTLSWSLLALAAAVIAFVLSFSLYAGGVLGAGDSKLFSATALLAGMGHLALLVIGTALVGGAIAAVTVASRPSRALVMLKMRGKGDFGRGIPYGVAIAAAAVAVVWAQVLHVDLPAL